ncbi:MAG: Gfo/Idh/MocA family oxidoreductase [Alphaproteobacteria bacterium]|nr:Gfo/Idh/MocA family oxidoreductase [Alphaproteobacteria bacterium]
MARKWRVAIVGAGIGAEHVAGFQANPDAFEIALICDANLERAQALAAKAGIKETHGAFDDALLARKDIDVIDVCLPPFMHEAAIERALKAGKHVVCEKPLVGSLAATDRLAALAKAQGVVLMPIFQYRSGNGLRKARHLVATGAAGKPYVASIEAHWCRDMTYYQNTWRGRRDKELGGVFLSHVIHHHDMLTHLMGEVRSVSALTAIRVNAVETEDCAGAVLALGDGAVAVTSVTLGAAGNESRLRFCFENVTMTSCALPYAPGRDPWTFEPKAPKDAAWLAAALAGAPSGLEGFAGQFADFRLALDGAAAPPVTAADARRSLELVTAIYHAVRTGMRVDLPLAPDHPAYQGWL